MTDKPFASMAEKRRIESRRGPAIYDCPKCGKHIEGDLAVVAHGIMGCELDKEK